MENTNFVYLNGLTPNYRQNITAANENLYPQVCLNGLSADYRQNITAPKEVSSQVCSNKTQCDSFSSSISSAQFSENLLSQHHQTGLFDGYDTIQGNINNKLASFNHCEEKTGALTKKDVYMGYLGDKEAQICIEKDTITGTIDGKEINLTVKRDMVGKGFSISGNIGDKEINIRNGAEISEAKDENDIITLCMSFNGSAINIKNGEFDSLRLSKEAYDNQKQALMDSLEMMQAVM